ncbi:FKBP17-2 [Symbiodinium pilosum]|uniref:peptidylprolyl isomerase n=1 Tax=Symbiodinium pilosum TaxID=2952 RepID=A0A812Q8T7_SYMPI|nr:FKBP17-2 [Symbiodinium pilosum]
MPWRSSAKQMRSSREIERKQLEDGKEIVKLASGVQFLDLRVGGGEVPELGDVVLAHVKGYLMEKDDPVFLDTRADGAPLVFPLGTETEGVTEGLSEALATMKLGSIRAVQVPSYLGYPNGLARAGVKPPLRLPIPQREGLRYEIELLRCVQAPKENGATSSQRLCCSDAEYPCKLSQDIRLDVTADASSKT